MVAYSVIRISKFFIFFKLQQFFHINSHVKFSHKFYINYYFSYNFKCFQTPLILQVRFAMRFGKTSDAVILDRKYFISGEEVKFVPSCKDLGITVDKSLKFHPCSRWCCGW